MKRSNGCRQLLLNRRKGQIVGLVRLMAKRGVEGGGELGERRVGRGLRRLLHMMPDVSGRAGPVSGARQRSQGGEKQGRAWATVGQLGRWLLGRPNRIVTFLIYSNFQTDLNLV
jgi:hypothetical protein